MQSLQSQIESILFVSDRPVSEEKCALITGASKMDVREALQQISERFHSEKGSGIVLVTNKHFYQLATHPDNAQLVAAHLKQDTTGDLTRPALETLSVISYRGPVTKAAIEEIRGVNCSLSLRNLLIRGLIHATDNAKTGEKTYSVSHEYIRHLGIARISDLPNYETLHSPPAALEVPSLPA